MAIPLPPMSNAAATTPTKRDGIYVAAMPLRASKGPAQIIMSLTYSLNLWDLQHYMVIIKPNSPQPQSQAFVFDFQPQDPENINVAISALSGRRVPGALLVRKLAKLPNRKCWFVGYSGVDSVSGANKFNEVWEADLRIGLHDCRDYTNGTTSLLISFCGIKHIEVF
ncbi:hypothetical protein C5167_039068 [Papaver somniferum]|uniref:PTB domain-containing protein n=1 Tax=Papaver somniferum TaxID=3469 RepID=A0A4Y7IFC8_PAPSO|nr:hypothetical protein C5167_039068 [Papaver somniferum]